MRYREHAYHHLFSKSLNSNVPESILLENGELSVEPINTITIDCLNKLDLIYQCRGDGEHNMRGSQIAWEINPFVFTEMLK